MSRSSKASRPCLSVHRPGARSLWRARPWSARWAEFERELTAERVRSGLAAAKARGKRLGRQPGQRPSDRLAPKVLAPAAQGRSYRLIGREVGLSKNTVAAIVGRARDAAVRP